MFLPGIAWNLGISQVASEYVLLQDVDNILRENFFEKNILGGNEFICGRPIRHLWGSCYCKKEYIDAVNGFNENCIYMGHDDTDLYKRMEAAGYKMRTFVTDTLHHKAHSKNLTICSQIRQESGNAWKLWWAMEHMNKLLCKELPWTFDSSKVRWSLELLEDRRWLAIRDVASCSNS
jgi:GT2 family glycosyltransferase